MKQRFSEEQIIRLLREAETPGHNREVCRQYGLSEQTFDHWRRQDQGLSVSALQRLKRLGAEDAKRTRRLAGHALALQNRQELIKKRGLL